MHELNKDIEMISRQLLFDKPKIVSKEFIYDYMCIRLLNLLSFLEPDMIYQQMNWRIKIVTDRTNMSFMWMYYSFIYGM